MIGFRLSDAWENVKMKIEITGASVSGVFFDIDGARKSATWSELRDAAKQSDADLSAAYTTILRRAENYAQRHSPLRVCYGRDSSNIWWHAWVETAWGEFGVGRSWRGGLTIVAADEGGTLAQEWMAKDDAKCIANRIAKIDPKHEVAVVRVPS